MRRLLLSLAVLGGVSAAGAAAHATPAVASPALKAASHVQTVQYYDPDWRAREHWRRRHEEEWRRREAWRERHERHAYGYGAPPPGVYVAPPPVIVRPY